MKRKEIEKQIEEWCRLEKKEIVFDSDIHEWKQNQSIFDRCVLNKQQLVFLIEDEEHNVFGGYIHQPISSYRYYEDGEMMGKSIRDSQAFVFSFHHSLESPQRYFIKQDEQRNAFTLYKQDYDNLFTIGNDDIAVMKWNDKEDCYCEEWSFEYGGDQHVFVGKEEAQTFTPLRIEVWQMGLSEHEMMKQQEQHIKQREILEKVTSMRCGKVLMECNECDQWKQLSLDLPDILFGKSHIMMIMEDMNGHVFGGYINNSIERIVKKEDGKLIGMPICDSHSFLFSFDVDNNVNNHNDSDKLSDNEWKVINHIYPIKSNEQLFAFTLFEEDYDVVAMFGRGDIMLMRTNRVKCCCQSKSFDYHSTHDERKLFGLKRFELWQME